MSDRRRARIRRRLLVLFWRLLNPLTRPLAGLAPWWVLLETTGRRTGRTRQTPLAAGPYDGDVMWLIAVHGRRSAWVLNLESEPRVRLRHRGRWRIGTAQVQDWDPAVVARFSGYARSGPRITGIDPLLVRVSLSG